MTPGEVRAVELAARRSMCCEVLDRNHPAYIGVPLVS